MKAAQGGWRVGGRTSERASERASGKAKRRAHLGHFGNELLHLLLLAADHGVRVGEAHGLAHWEPAQIVLLDALTQVAAAAVPVGWGWKGWRGVVRNAARGVCGIISSSLLRHHSQLKPIVVVLVLHPQEDHELEVRPHVVVLADVAPEAGVERVGGAVQRVLVDAADEARAHRVLQALLLQLAKLRERVNNDTCEARR